MANGNVVPLEQNEQKMWETLHRVLSSTNGHYRESDWVQQQLEKPNVSSISDLPGWFMSQTRPAGMDKNLPAIQADTSKSDYSSLFSGINGKPMTYGKMYVMDPKDHHVSVELIYTDENEWDLGIGMFYQRTATDRVDPSPMQADYVKIVRGEEPEEQEESEVIEYGAEISEDLAKLFNEVKPEGQQSSNARFTKKDRHFNDTVYISGDMTEEAFRLIYDKVARHTDTLRVWHEAVKARGDLRKPDVIPPGRLMSIDRLDKVAFRIKEFRGKQAANSSITREEFEKDVDKGVKEVEARRKVILKNIESIREKVGKWYDKEYKDVHQEPYESVQAAAEDKNTDAE